MLRTTAEIICWVQLLTLSVEIICWEQLFSPSVEISCWDDILRTTAEIICWVQLLRLYVEIICSDYLLIWSVEFNGPAKTCLKPMSIATASPKSFQNPYVLLQNMDLRPVTSIKPMQIKVNTKEYSKNPQLSSASADFFLKTQAYNSKYTKSSPHAGVVLLPVRASSVEEHLPPALTQLRTHARTTRTRNETETDFPIGPSWRFFPPKLR